METGKIGRLLNCASKGDIEGVRILLDEGLPVDSPDYDGRTAMHLAASEGHYDVVDFLLKRKANVNPVDRWRKTPLADARRYEAMYAKTGTKGGLYTKVCELLVTSNGSTCSPFEIDLDMQQLLKASPIPECALGDIRLTNWRGTKVAARIIHRNNEQSTPKSSDSQLIRQLSLLQRLRHPNIVQFLGAVTNFQNKSKPLVLVTEHLPNGNLQQLLRGKKRRKFQAKDAVNYALDIARGMNYLHHRQHPIVHSELNPTNLLRDAAGHLKVAGLGLSKLLGCVYEGKARGVQNLMHPTYKGMKSLYRAPELEKEKTRSQPQKSVDVYSFGMILYEMFEGAPSLASRQAHEVVARKDLLCRTTVAPNLKNLGKLIMECLARDPEERPEFHEIIRELEKAKDFLMKKPWWAPRPIINMGSTLVITVSQHWYNCVNNTRRALSHSIASVEDSMRNHGRSRRGETNITNFDPIEEEAQDEDKEKALITQS